MPTIFRFDRYIRQVIEPKHGSLGKVARHKSHYAVLRRRQHRTPTEENGMHREGRQVR